MWRRGVLTMKIDNLFDLAESKDACRYEIYLPVCGMYYKIEKEDLVFDDERRIVVIGKSPEDYYKKRHKVFLESNDYFDDY